jgi:single-strand DNA-binding protein
MNSIRNKVTLIGNLGSNPEVKVLDNNKRVARLSVATNEVYRNSQGEKVIETTWHNAVAWGPLAQLVEKFLKKGSEVCLEGKLVNKSWTDKEGIKRYTTEILLHAVQMTGTKMAA